MRTRSTSSASSDPARAAAAPPAYSERTRERVPLRLPGSGRPLVLLGERAE